MANITNNYNLNKPLPEENVNIDVLNQNMDIIDTNLKSLSDKINNVENNIPSTDGFVSQSTLNTTLTSYAKKSDLPEEYDDTELTNKVSDIETNLGGHTVKSDVPENAVFTDTIYDDTALKTELTIAITTAISDKADSSDIPTKVSQLTNDKGYLTSSDIDTSQSHTHSNKSILDKLTQEYIDKIDGIADGAEQNVQSDWNAVSGDAFIKNKPEFANVAMSDSYNDLVDKPTIPTKTSQLTNDSGFKTTDNNTTYSLSKSGSTITLTGSDGSTTSVIDSNDNTVYTHPTYTARTGKPVSNQTPTFGGTATVSQITSDETGHVTSATDRTIKIPNTLSNGTGTAGLIKTSSTVTSNSGYTACPVINGVPYYKDTNTTYSHPTTAGNKHIPSGGSSGQILEWSASGTAKWVTPDFGSSGGSGTIYYQTSTPSDATNNSVWIV